MILFTSNLKNFNNDFKNDFVESCKGDSIKINKRNNYIYFRDFGLSVIKVDKNDFDDTHINTNINEDKNFNINFISFDNNLDSLFKAENYIYFDFIVYSNFIIKDNFIAKNFVFEFMHSQVFLHSGKSIKQIGNAFYCEKENFGILSEKIYIKSDIKGDIKNDIKGDIKSDNDFVKIYKNDDLKLELIELYNKKFLI